MRCDGKHALVPLLDPQRVLGAEIELDAAVEELRGVVGGRIQALDGAQAKRLRHREHIGILDDRNLPEPDARLRDQIRGDQPDVGLPRIQHFQHLGGGSLMDIDLEARARTAATPDRIRQQRLDDRIEAGDADDRALAGAEFP